MLDLIINMADIRCGDRFWECEAGQNCELEAMADAHVNGDTVTLQARVVATNEPLVLAMRLSAPSYAPRLYRAPQYRGGGGMIDIESMKGRLVEGLDKREVAALIGEVERLRQALEERTMQAGHAADCPYDLADKALRRVLAKEEVSDAQ